MLTFLLLALLRAASATSNVTVEDAIPEAYLNLASGNSLWTALVKNCQNSSSMGCVEKNMYAYLRETLDHPEDLQVTPFLKFAKNQRRYEAAEEEEEGDEEPRSAIEEMSRSLHGRSVNFLMNHDMEVQLPDGVFRGGILKISPRGFEDSGALVRLEVVPREDQAEPEGRIFLKKIKKYISEKLLYALMAILLVIKLLAAKFMFFLPMMVGAVTAKKLLIKVLLFLFPALHHLFKLCAYVPHGAKFHHHKHQIQHIHHVSHKPHLHHHGHDEGVEVIRPHSAGPPDGGHGGGPWHGPSLHHHVDIEEPHKPFFNPHEHELEYYSGGPGLSNHFINERQDSTEDTNEVQGWGQAQRKKPTTRPLTPTEIESMVVKAEREAVLKARLQQERQRIQEENARLQDQLRQAMKLQEKLKQQAATVKARLPVVPPSANLQIPMTEQKHIYSAKVKQEEKKTPVPATQSPFEKALHEAATITYDSFYSPILEKIDRILGGLGFQDEGCRERLICSMYKNPGNFSPHSNLLSAELSRDSSELQKPTSTNAAVIRFYRYVQAARDGQDKRECLRLYPACSISTEP